MHRLLTGPLTIERLTIPIANLPLYLEGTRIVQLSDFHFDGLRLSTELLQAVIQQSNALEPDLVVLTGDLVTHDPQPIYELAGHLKHLTSRCGVYAVLGNHDNVTFSGRLTIINALHQVGIMVLWNEVAYPLGNELPLVGLADFWSGEFKPALVFDALDPALPRLVLSHNPDTAVPLQRWRVDLQLSGHTHGGQIVIPGWGPLPAVLRQARIYVPRFLHRYIPYMSDECAKVVKHWDWASGRHTVGTNELYVNRGLGTYLPGRFFCPPELTLLELTQKG